MNEDSTSFLSNSELWESFKSGDIDSYERIFKIHYGFLLNYGFQLNRNKEEVEDCLQSLFSNLWERRAFLGPCNSIRSYLVASTRRLMLKMLKEKSRYVELDLEKTNFYLEPSAETLLIKDQSTKNRIETLQKMMNKLPERQKEALYLRFYGELSFNEIAHTMDISTRAVYKLIYKALDNLGEQMNTDSHNLSLLLSIFF